MDFVKKQNVQKSSFTDAVKKMENQGQGSPEDPKASKKVPAAKTSTSRNNDLFHDQNLY